MNRIEVMIELQAIFKKLASESAECRCTLEYLMNCAESFELEAAEELHRRRMKKIFSAMSDDFLSDVVCESIPEEDLRKILEEAMK